MPNELQGLPNHLQPEFPLGSRVGVVPQADYMRPYTGFVESYRVRGYEVSPPPDKKLTRVQWDYSIARHPDRVLATPGAKDVPDWQSLLVQKGADRRVITHVRSEITSVGEAEMAAHQWDDRLAARRVQFAVSLDRQELETLLEALYYELGGPHPTSTKPGQACDLIQKLKDALKTVQKMEEARA